MYLSYLWFFRALPFDKQILHLLCKAVVLFRCIFGKLIMVVLIIFLRISFKEMLSCWTRCYFDTLGISNRKIGRSARRQTCTYLDRSR